MTAIQVEYNKLQEQKRHNLEVERQGRTAERVSLKDSESRATQAQSSVTQAAAATSQASTAEKRRQDQRLFGIVDSVRGGISTLISLFK